MKISKVSSSFTTNLIRSRESTMTSLIFGASEGAPCCSSRKTSMSFCLISFVLIAPLSLVAAVRTRRSSQLTRDGGSSDDLDLTRNPIHVVSRIVKGLVESELQLLDFGDAEIHRLDCLDRELCVRLFS